MVFTIQATDGKARVGKLKTAHGELRTPFFMPVATRASGKYINTDDYHTLGAEVLISNALINYLKPGLEVIDKAGGLRKFMDWEGALFTDCGGFQMSRSFFLGSSKRGLHFQSPFNGQKHLLTPQKSMRIQLVLGSSVAMMLDNMPPIYASKQEVKKSLEKTHRWAKESLAEHTLRRTEKIVEVEGKHYHVHNHHQLLFGISQGALYEDLRKESAHYISTLTVNGKGFDGIAIGGLAIGEKQEEMLMALDAALSVIPENKPRYLMGVGNPLDILEAVSRGIDLFDSVYPTQNARHNTLFTWEGKIDIAAGKYRLDFTSLDKQCDCFVCKHYTKAYLHHLVKIKEPIVKRYLQYHNLYFMQRFMEKIRQHIQQGTFHAFAEDFKKRWQRK